MVGPSRNVGACVVLSIAFTGRAALAEEPAEPPPPTPPTLTMTAPPSPPSSGKPSPFVVDPVMDGGAMAVGVTFGLLSGAILGTGEVRPQQISPSFRPGQLLKIDRGALRQSIDPNARTLSNVGLGALAGYALLDTVLDGFRTGPNSSLVDAVMYVEAVAITQGMTNLAKIAFRRPRPIAYMEREEAIRNGADPATYQNAETDSALSFFSGHASQAAALAATATYIAFRRAPGTPRPWLTLLGGTALTAFVGYERVRSGAHFPTDVFAGALAGAAVGALVVHLHRAEPKEQRPLWFGAAPRSDGGSVSLTGLF